jgi:nucleoside-diphosphate-sugar epimerase
MNVFITGATGFIGTHLVKRLSQTEHEMCCLVRKTSNVRVLEELGTTLVTGDVTDRDSPLEGMKGCDGVINLANIYSYWEPDKRIYTDVNVEGTRNVMEGALETGVSKVVHVSSVVTYGKPADCPFTEESPVGPVRFSEYARTKYAGDLIAWELYEKKGLPLVMIYPGAVLGPGDPKSTG